MQKPREMTVKEAAKLLNKSELFIRIALQRGILPFGTALKIRSKYTYYISRPKLFEYIGKKESEQKGA